MKQLQRLGVLAIVLAACLSSCTPQDNSDQQKVATGVPATQVALPETPSLTTIEWEETHRDFGQVALGDTLRSRFEFTNSGKTPLVIESVKKSCGCTEAIFSEGEIAPGATGFVETTMPAKSAGIVKKTVSVTANTDPKTFILSFEAEVVE